MTDSKQVEVLDLRHFTAAQLRPLLEEEAGVWLQRLRWDYRSSIALLLQYLDARILPGFVAVTGGRISGYSFFVYEGAKAVVGDLYVSKSSRAPLLVTESLVKNLLGVLKATPGVDRVEAQLLLYEADVLPPLFAGFTTYRRLFLECNLRSESHRRALAIPADLELCPWTSNFYQPSAELIHAAYLDHIDSDINDQYRTLGGSLRFMHNVVRFPGCGVFDPESSWVLRDRATRTLAAILLCSQITSAGIDGPVAHITQLCVAPGFRNRGLGRALLEVCLERLTRQGYRALTLTVTEANRPAVDLYDSAEFEVREKFDALVWNKP